MQRELLAGPVVEPGDRRSDGLAVGIEQHRRLGHRGDADAEEITVGRRGQNVGDDPQDRVAQLHREEVPPGGVAVPRRRLRRLDDLAAVDSHHADLGQRGADVDAQQERP